MRIKQKYLYQVLLVVFVFSAIMSGFYIYSYESDVAEDIKVIDNLKALAVTQIEADKATVDSDNYKWSSLNPAPIPKGEVINNTQSVSLENDYSPLKSLNPDFVGWLSIEDTLLDYPVMQTNDRPDYYLRKNFYGEYSNLGTPYMEEYADADKPSDNLLIYGHHVKNGTMFGSLEKYEDKAFYEDHKYIKFDTLSYNADYEIIAVFKTVVYTNKDDEFRYWEFIDATSEEEFDGYIRKIKTLSLYDIPVTANYGDKLLTLSTCEYSNKNGRLVIVAKML